MVIKRLKDGVIFVLVCLQMTSCQFTDKNKSKYSKTVQANMNENLGFHQEDLSNNNSLASCPDFPCTENLEIWQGTIQKLKKHQLREVLLFGIGNCEDESIEVIWKHNHQKSTAGLSLDELDLKIFSEEYASFVFTLPLVKVEDYLIDDPYKFPCKVSAFVIESGTCKKVDELVVLSWEEYAQLQYRTVYSK